MKNLQGIQEVQRAMEVPKDASNVSAKLEICKGFLNINCRGVGRVGVQLFNHIILPLKFPNTSHGLPQNPPPTRKGVDEIANLEKNRHEERPIKFGVKIRYIK